jgi:hypothetical protein
MIMGYQNGRLDNTFTGVIETGLIYTEIAANSNSAQIFKHLIGMIAPLPNTFIPDEYIYSVSAIRDYIMPGGGIFAAFSIYFSYSLSVIYLTVIHFAKERAQHSVYFGILLLIITATSARWWLYGPFVIFKYFGIFLLIYISSKFIEMLLLGAKRSIKL